MSSFRDAWKVEEHTDFTVVSGRDFAWQWVLFVGMTMALVGLMLFERKWGFAVGVLAATAGVALSTGLAFGRGFRLRISPSGFDFARTWFGIPYWRTTLSISATCTLNDPPDGPPDGVFLENRLHDEDVSFGGVDNCRALHAAIVTAHERWRRKARGEARTTQK